MSSPSSPVADKLLSQALALPSTERARLAASLIESLDEEQEASLDALWRTEVARRVEDLDAGRVSTIDWEDVRRMLRR